MLQELNRAIEYIEEHLTDELYLEKISEYAGISDYHFRTVFFYLAGMSLSEYIKGRRLSEANKDLLMGEKVTDVAYKYGYGSMDGFARAFKKWSGLLPSDVIKKGSASPSLNFHLSSKSKEEILWNVESKKNRRFIWLE